MGSHLHSYLGPYVRITPRKETRKNEHFGCPNPACERSVQKSLHGRVDEFCGKCGTRHETVPVILTVRLTSPYDVIGEALSSFGGPEWVYLIPNVRRPGDPNPKGFRDEPQHIDLYGDLSRMTLERDWLREVFAPEIAKLRESYDDVLVSWGFHQYER